MNSKIKFNLRDRSLYYLGTNKYQNSLVSDRQSEYIDWVKDGGEATFLTYTELPSNRRENVIVLESSVLVKNHIDHLIQNRNQYGCIFTHNSTLLENFQDTYWIPGGGCWIGTEWGGGEEKIYDKELLCSFFSSKKILCDLHKERWDNFLYLEHSGLCDCFTTEKFIKPVEYLAPYMFSIIYENNIDKKYFTEKILNCFATGTIPIYKGASQIGDFFDLNGIIEFKNDYHLRYILQSLTPSLYYGRIESIKRNHETYKQYSCIEDYMWTNYLKHEKYAK